MAEKEFPRFFWKDKPTTHITAENVFASMANFRYRPIVETMYGELQLKVEGDVMKAVQSVDVTIDRDRLIKALQSDRDAYVRGYSEGCKGITRCADCDHFIPCEGSEEGYCVELQRGMPNNGFCCFSEGKG